MKKSKRGIFFTLAAMALAIVVLLSFSVYKKYEMKENIDTIDVRIKTVSSFVKDVEQDLEKGLEIASFRAFTSMGQYIASNGTFITDLKGSFNSLILEGKLNSEEPSLMKDSTFTDWVGKIEAQANKIGVLVNFTILEVEINQTNPWHIGVNANINFTAQDNKNTSMWRRSKNITIQVNIENFEDPLYLINSYGRVTNSIVKSPITDFVNNNDVTNLMTHMNHSYYIESTTAPSFLMRLQGDLSNSSTGIESLINVQKFKDQGLIAKDRSVVDYIYFGSQNTVNYRINSTPSWFKLDSAHLAVYEVVNLTI